eukprot:4765984-Prymnesium_polylepis.1
MAGRARGGGGRPNLVRVPRPNMAGRARGGGGRRGHGRPLWHDCDVFVPFALEQAADVPPHPSS